MNQTPAAVIVLAASVMAYAAHAASVTAQPQTAVIMTLCALALGLWGVISLFAACVREREMLIDSHARLDVLDRVMVREPLRAIKEATRPKRPESRRPELQRAESQRPLEISGDVQAKLTALAQLQGRDRSELLEEMLRKQLPDFDKSRVA